jgi:hypothetical protein
MVHAQSLLWLPFSKHNSAETAFSNEPGELNQIVPYFFIAFTACSHWMLTIKHRCLM